MCGESIGNVSMRGRGRGMSAGLGEECGEEELGREREGECGAAVAGAGDTWSVCGAGELGRG